MITFGSIAKTSEMPELLKYSLQEAFAHFSDFTFLLKNESIIGSAPVQTHSNVFQARWIPQLKLIGWFLNFIKQNFKLFNTSD